MKTGFLAALYLSMIAPTAIASRQAAAPVPLFTSVVALEPEPPIPGARRAWQVELNHEAIRQPAASVLVNVPDLPGTIFDLERWSPRTGFIDAFNPDHPLGLHQIPDPNAPAEAFSWAWYSHGLSLTVHEGIATGRLYRGQRWFYLSPRSGMTVLYEPVGSVGSAELQPVPALHTWFVMVLATLIPVCAALWQRKHSSR